MAQAAHPVSFHPLAVNHLQSPLRATIDSPKWAVSCLRVQRKLTWESLALAGILLLAAGLLFWELPENGWANAYYSGAVRAASQSWAAFWTASLDVSGTVSLDKTPLAIWMMALSARLFGFSPWAVLLPNALCALGSVALLHNLVKRSLGSGVALLAALFLAITPVAVTVGRFNNPDSLLVLLLLASAWAATRAIETGRLRHFVACGVLIGLAFNTKMLQAYLILPAVGGAFWLARRRGLDIRWGRVAWGTAALALVSGAWICVMSALPSGARPWVGDTTTNSWWQLVFGANGVGRIHGLLSSTPAGPGAGPIRLLQGPTGGQFAWLLPLALAGAVLGVRAIWRGERIPRSQASLLLWIGWSAVHLFVFSLLVGLFHAYYTSVLAPALAALAAFGARELWAERHRSASYAWAGPVALLATTGVAVWLLRRTPHFLPGLVPALVSLAAIGLTCALFGRGRWRRPTRLVAIASTLAAVAAGPLSYSWATTERHLGGIDPLGGPGAHEVAWASDESPSVRTLVRYLVNHQGHARYLAAASGSLVGAPIALEAQRPVLIMGGFAGSDPAPSVTNLAALVAHGQVRTLILAGIPRASDGALSTGLGGARARASWARAHCTRVPIVSALPAPSGWLEVDVYRCNAAHVH